MLPVIYDGTIRLVCRCRKEEFPSSVFEHANGEEDTHVLMMFPTINLHFWGFFLRHGWLHDLAPTNQLQPNSHCSTSSFTSYHIAVLLPKCTPKSWKDFGSNWSEVVKASNPRGWGGWGSSGSPVSLVPRCPPVSYGSGTTVYATMMWLWYLKTVARQGKPHCDSKPVSPLK